MKMRIHKNRRQQQSLLAFHSHRPPSSTASFHIVITHEKHHENWTLNGMFDVDLCIYLYKAFLESMLYTSGCFLFCFVRPLSLSHVGDAFSLSLSLNFSVNMLFVWARAKIEFWSFTQMHLMFGSNNTQQRQRSTQRHNRWHDEWNIRAAFVFVPLHRSLDTFLWESFWSGNGMQSGNKYTQYVYVAAQTSQHCVFIFTHTHQFFYIYI